MKQHSDYITHLDNPEDVVYLRTQHFPVNMRLFNSSPEYKQIILQQCAYIRSLCLETKEGYKKLHGMSSANAGLSFNIIGVTQNRNKKGEYCQIMINPEIISYSGDLVESWSNCGSLTLKEPIRIQRFSVVKVKYFDENGVYFEKEFSREQGSLTIQHEIDHNLGILITDRAIE